MFKFLINKAPKEPGIYKMIDISGKILYIGKAKNLANRLKSYLNPQSSRIEQMVSLVSDIEFIILKNEKESLLLEAKLIYEHQPKYNILLKTDKALHYILITNDEYPIIMRKRILNSKIHEEVGEIFGPFLSATEVDKFILELRKIFHIRSCNNNYFNSCHRPCIEYQIKHCSAPCHQKVNIENYTQNIQNLKLILKGKIDKLLKIYNLDMLNASNNMNYEYALTLRDKIKLLEKLMIKQNIINVKIENADLLAIHQNTISIMRFRNSNSYGIKSIFFEDINEFFSIIYRFYEEINLPKQFYVICTCFSYDLTPYLKLKNDNKEFDNSILEFLKQIFFRMFHVEPKITMFHVEHNNFENELNSLQENQLFHVEHKAVKDVKEIKSLLLLLLKNAENFSTTSLHQKNNTKNLFAEIQTNFQLNKIPKLIEIYDNSHINGTDAVGVLVAADVNGFNKSLYKKFYINNNKNGDDYDMMKEVITRRLERLRSRKDPMPDLLIIDGGPGQLSVSYKILLEYQKNGHFLDLEIISIAKGIKRSGDEKFYIIENSSPIDISSNQKLFYYLQNLRNEAHRFAVASHIKKRDKKMTESCLDHVIGIGPKKKKALLNYFGSTWNIKNASAEEIKKVIKVSLELAKAVINSIK